MNNILNYYELCTIIGHTDAHLINTIAPEIRQIIFTDNTIDLYFVPRDNTTQLHVKDNILGADDDVKPQKILVY